MIEDWEINVEVRGVLVKRFINTKLINISTTSGCVLIKGELDFQKEVKEEHIPFILLKVEDDIKYIKGVKELKINFNDWMKLDGRWINTKKV